MYFAGQDDSMR